MTFDLTIDCDNAAFGDTAEEAEAEVARLLMEMAQRVAHGDIRNGIGRSQYRTLFDINGNDVGRASFIYANGEDRR